MSLLVRSYIHNILLIYERGQKFEGEQRSAYGMFLRKEKEGRNVVIKNTISKTNKQYSPTWPLKCKLNNNRRSAKTQWGDNEASPRQQAQILVILYQKSPVF